MLAGLIASHITGNYDFTYAAFTLPEQVVIALLPTSWRDSAFLSDSELSAAGLQVPPAGEGRRWCCIQSGLQKNTGMSVPFGRHTFWESKLEIPFLRHPESNAPTPFTFKQTLLFSSAMMSSSSSSMAGLRSHKVDFETSETSHEAKGYMSVQDDDREPRDAAWSEQLVRAVLGGWWAGERTGDMANKFIMSPQAPGTVRPRLALRLHLPSFLKQSIEETQRLVSGTDVSLDEDGWLDVSASGWQLYEGTRLEIKKVTSI